jgi:hypothetical protein
MKAEFQKSGGRDLALFEGGKILADPEGVFLLRFMLQASLQHKSSKPDCGAAIRLACKHLVQRAESQTTPEASIGFRMAERGKQPTMHPSKPRFFEGAFEGGQPFGIAGWHGFVHDMF